MNFKGEWGNFSMAISEKKTRRGHKWKINMNILFSKPNLWFTRLIITDILFRRTQHKLQNASDVFIFSSHIFIHTISDIERRIISYEPKSHSTSKSLNREKIIEYVYKNGVVVILHE